MNIGYTKQVKLLLDVLPEVAKEDCFAMHGGTAINLFVREMPRLSVDIDLTYINIAERDETIDGINRALLQIKGRIEALRSSINVQHNVNTGKLLLDEQGVLIKIEANMVGRGLLGDPNNMPLCETAQDQFDVFCVMPIVPLGQLYGSKLCAALDRQHPRDLFDVRLLLDNEGLSDDIKRGLVFSLISSNRPTHELLAPRLQDQRIAFEKQFDGMSTIRFSYDDYEQTRLQLTNGLKDCLNDEDRQFLLSINQLEPDWSTYNYQQFPSVKWKIMNLEKFRDNNPDTYKKHLTELTNILST